MKLSKATKITMIVCGTLFAMSVLFASVWSGSKIDAMELFEIIITGVGGVLVGMGFASRTKHLPLLAFITLTGMASVSCGAFQNSNGTLDPCKVQKTIVSAFDVGIQSLDLVPGTDGPGWQEAKKYSNGVVALGKAATRGCELERGNAGWQQWVGLALETTMAIVAQFGGAANDLPANPPQELRRALMMLGAESNMPSVERRHPAPEYQ